jgi:hypothetical protein
MDQALMMKRKMFSFKADAALPLGLLAGLASLLGSAAHAESNPYYLGGSLGVNHVSNVYRQANADQHIGRQHLTVDATLNQSHYDLNPQLNNHGYTLRGVLDWATIERISGTLSASMSSALASYNVGGNVLPVFEKNIEKDRRVQAVVRVGLVTRYSMEASLTHYDQDFSLAAYNALVYHQNAGSMGLYFQANDLLRLGVALRHTVGEYPRYPVVTQVSAGSAPFYVFAADGFKRNDLDLTAGWKPSGASKVDARLSWTDSKHDVVPSLDYKGVTGALSWNWQPTGKLNFFTRLARDTGTQLTNLGANVDRVGYSLDFNPSYEVTSKIALTGGASMRRSTYKNDAGAQSHDNDHNYSLGLRYAYSRSVSFNCQGYRAGRDSSIAIYTYSATGYGCTVQGMIY